MVRARQLVRQALSTTECRVGESDFGSSTNGRAPVYPRLARDRLWGAKWPSIGFAVDNREAWLLSYSLGLAGGAGGSLSRLGHFGRSQAEGPAGCRESVPAAAVTGAAAQAPAAALAQCGPTVLDLRQSMVRWLAQFASYCETRNGAAVASTGLACLLVLALKSPAPEDW